MNSNMQEILNKRTISAKHFDNGDGTFTMISSMAPLHYPDNNDEWVDIDLTPEDKGTYWAFEKANQKLYLAKDFGAPQLIRFDAVKPDGVTDKTIYFEPTQLAWVNKQDLSDKVVFRTAQAVQGVVNGNKVTYTDAFGPGLDYEVIFAKDVVSKNLVINAKNNLELPPTPQHKLVLLSKFTGDNLKVIGEGLSEWDKTTDYTAERIKFEAADGKSFKMTKASIWDTEDNKQPVNVIWKKINGTLWQAKVLPKSFLQTASYPIRTDAAFGPQDWGSNSRQVVIDGSSNSYNTVCNTATGAEVYDITTAVDQNMIHDSLSGGLVYVRRADCQFDTSSIGTGNTVWSAYMTFYGDTGTVNTDSWNVVAVDNTNNGALSDPIVVGDFGDFDTNITTDIIGTETFAKFATASNQTFTLTSFAAINITGTTKIGIRGENEMTEDYDGSASDPTGFNIMRIAVGVDTPFINVTYYPTATSISDDFSTNLVSYWEMEEADNATRTDSTATGNDLDVSNTVAQTTGIIDNGASFVAASSEYLSIAEVDQTGLDLSPDLSMSMWIKLSSQPSSSAGFALIGKYRGAAGARQYALSYDNAAGVYGLTWRTSVNGSSVNTDKTGSYELTTGSWFHVGIAHDGSAGTCEVYVNGVNIDTLTGYAATITNGSEPFKIGHMTDVAGYTNGVIDEVGIWSSVLTEDNFRSIYNGTSTGAGTGIPYAVAAATSIKTVNGLAIASVKSVNGLAIASVKSVNGLSNVS